MNTARDILTYAKQHDIRLIAENGGLVMDAPEEALTADFVKTVKKHKAEILSVITERWNPELAEQGYVWCLDCKHFDNMNCNHTDNPFHTVTKCSEAPRKCQWFESSILIY